MSATVNTPKVSDWMESSGLTHILRVFKIAIHPEKIALALAAILVTIIWGNALDAIWTRSGNGVAADAITQYVGRTDTASNAGGEAGIFSVFRDYQLTRLRDAIESVRYGRILGPIKAGEPVPLSLDPTGEHEVLGAFANLVLMGRGLVWMIKTHYFYASLFLAVLILIWAFFGGAICRSAAVQYARDESITMKEALQFAREKLLGGFFMAYMVPLLICLFIGLFLVAGGLVLRIPWFGDIVGGLLFFLALLGGFLIALVLVGTVAGGSLFWPTVAVEGSDSFDAISRSFSYVYGRPLRAIWYAFLLLVYGSFCWLFVKFLLWMALASTHLFVGLGAGDKFDKLWSPPTFETLHQMSPGAWTQWELSAAPFIGLWILPILGLVWAFLASFYFSGSTAIYYLLRRDVDGTDLGDIYIEEKEEKAVPASPPKTEKPAAGPVVTESPAPSAETPKPAVSTASEAPIADKETSSEQVEGRKESAEGEAGEKSSTKAETQSEENTDKEPSKDEDKDEGKNP